MRQKWFVENSATYGVEQSKSGKRPQKQNLTAFGGKNSNFSLLSYCKFAESKKCKLPNCHLTRKTSIVIFKIGTVKTTRVNAIQYNNALFTNTSVIKPFFV